ncbi:MAG: hypothetical protein WDN47_02580 [Candidatus Doudnabacteria bacterium]
MENEKDPREQNAKEAEARPIEERIKETGSEMKYFETDPYPEHLKEGVRLKMMLDIMKHEAKKQPGLSEDEYAKRAEEIDGWLTDPEKYQMSGSLRDILNKIWADFRGFKLKFGIVEILTASNVDVKEETLPLDSLVYMDYFTTKVLKIAGEDGGIGGTTGSISAAGARKYFKEHPDKFEEIRERTNSNFSTESVPREYDKILVYRNKDESGQERLIVLDGNGRLTRKITQAPDDEQQNIRAWVVTKTDDKPLHGYWIPTSRFADKLEEASRAESEQERSIVKKQIFDLFRISPGVGPRELERASSVNPEFAEEVLHEWASPRPSE